VILDLGGWPVTDPEWSPAKSIPIEDVLALLKKNFTLGVIIEKWIGPDDRNSKRHIIQVGGLIEEAKRTDWFEDQLRHVKEKKCNVLFCSAYPSATYS
jgi:hypothetical protein